MHMATAPKFPVSSVPQSADLNWKKEMNEKETGEFLALLDDLFVNFSWCIWHEGERSYDDSYPGKMRDITTVRNEAIALQSHNPPAQALIRAASNNQLIAMVAQTRARVYGEFQLVGNFQWVAYHEGARDQFRLLLSKRDFAGIRGLYMAKQAHNPNAKNLLAAVTDADIETIVNGL
jgi:hypothetical protein